MAGCADVLGLPDPQPLELGADCTGSAAGDISKCPAATDTCLPISGSADMCSISCGTGPPGSGTSAPPPPQGGDQLCATLATTGTPSVITWYCVIACGTFDGQDLGTCPTGLTCTNNFCQ